MNEDQTIYRIQKLIVDNHNEFKESEAKFGAILNNMEVEIKRLDLAITGIAKLTQANTRWLNLVNIAIKQLRANQVSDILKEKPQIKKNWFNIFK